MNVLRWRVYVQDNEGEDFQWDGQLFASYEAALNHAQREYGERFKWRIVMSEVII